MSGQISDAQALLNITNLIDNGRIHEPTLKAFAKLFDLLNLPERELALLAENMRFALDTSPENRSAPQAALAPQRVEQLVWLGLSKDTLSLLAPYITLLPVRTPLNVNTASAELLYAAVPGLQLDAARRIVSQRARQHFRSLSEAGQASGEFSSQITEGQHAIATRFFEVRGRLRLNDLIVQERSLVQRDGLDVRTLWRTRTALAPQLGNDPTATPLGSLQ